MTVEQNVLQQSAAQKHQQTFLNQLREITGINDAQILQQAWKQWKLGVGSGFPHCEECQDPSAGGDNLLPNRASWQ
nr:ubiquitin carboxyl-terminal hydrolase 25-like [Equus asinus]